MEVLFILEKYNVAHQFLDVLQELQSKRYIVFPLDVTVAVRVFTLGHGLEMHDRIIVAIARMHTAPIVIKDSMIHKNYPLIIWRFFNLSCDDLNPGATRNRTVNSLDWSIMASVWFTNDATADINKDGIVNSIDFSLMNANWGRTI